MGKAAKPGGITRHGGGDVAKAAEAGGMARHGGGMVQQAHGERRHDAAWQRKAAAWQRLSRRAASGGMAAVT